MIVKVNYARPGEKGKSPGAMVRYMDEDRAPEQERKPEPEREPERKPEHEPAPAPEPSARVAARFGDRGAFVREALSRAKNRTAYVHVVVSPEHGSLYEDRDFEKLVSPWSRERDGRDCAFYAVVHRNTDHPHLHIAAARDRFTKGELERLKGETRERMAELDRLRGGSFAKGLRTVGGGAVEKERDARRARGCASA
ncbi:MAG: hypothetical protein AB1425_01435 [Actinomycetota bacterium]